MLTRTWITQVQPEWKVTLAGSAAQRADEPSLADAPDDALVAACVAGHRDAFDVIVQRHQRPIYNLCYRFVRSHEDASDLTQDVFIRAYRSLARFKQQSSLGTWLYRIGVNVCLNRMSAPAARKELPVSSLDDGVAVSREESPADALLRGERAAEVRAAIARLPKKQRATLVLRAYQELPHEQIAAILGSSVGAVKANFFHALKNLKKLLDDR
jgi:RNA polymerase sigma-70 factor, ECF subfamily